MAAAGSQGKGEAARAASGAVRLPSFLSSQPFSKGYAPNGAVRGVSGWTNGAV
jgi:hypothetical protein